MESVIHAFRQVKRVFTWGRARSSDVVALVLSFFVFLLPRFFFLIIIIIAERKSSKKKWRFNFSVRSTNKKKTQKNKCSRREKKKVTLAVFITLTSMEIKVTENEQKKKRLDGSDFSL